MMRNDEMAEYEQAQQLQYQQCAAGQYPQSDFHEGPVESQFASTGANSNNEAVFDADQEDGNTQGRQSIMTIRRSDKLQEVKERCFERLNQERLNLIRRRREQSGYGTYTGLTLRQGAFDMPLNGQGIVSKATKQAANEVDQEMLLESHAILEKVFGEERDAEDLPDMTVEDWNEVYEECQQTLTQLLAEELIKEKQQDPEYEDNLAERFGQLEIEYRAKNLGPDSDDFSSVCGLCKKNTARILQGSRIVCELRGCLDIDVRCQVGRLEDFMIKLDNSLVQEHKCHSEETNAGCFEGQNDGTKHCTLELQRVMNEDYQFESVTEEMQINESDQLVLFMTCKDCDFLDFMTLD